MCGLTFSQSCTYSPHAIPAAAVECLGPTVQYTNTYRIKDIKREVVCRKLLKNANIKA